MLIRNYGLYWKKDDVFWGKQKNSGCLYGKKVGRSAKQPTVNFRDQVGFYALYNEQFQLVYFGQAGRGKRHTLFDRLKQHLNDHLAERWSLFSWFGTRIVKRNGTLSTQAANIAGSQEVFLDQVEAIMIAVAEPPNNLQGGRFGRAEKYIQHRDENNLGPSDQKMLRKIYDELKGASIN